MSELDYGYDEEESQKEELSKNAMKIEVVGYGLIEGRKAKTTLVKKTKQSIFLRFDKTQIDLSFPIKTGMAKTVGDVAGWIIPEEAWEKLNKE